MRCCRPPARLLCLAREKMVGPAGFAPASPRSQCGMFAATPRPPSVFWKWIPRPVLPRHCPYYEYGAFLPLPQGRFEKWRSREDSHPDPPPSRGGMHDLITPREQTVLLKKTAPCRCRPGAVCLEDRDAAVTPMTHKIKLGRNPWLTPVSRRPLLLFRETLISLS